MSGTLMLVNPRKRGHRKAHRSAAQKAATRRMLAARHGKRRSNPSPRRHTRHLSRVRHAVHHVTHRRRHRRHNPIGFGGITGMLMNGLKGAGGAIVVNAITNYLPDAVKTGNLQYATRAALAIVLGTAGRKVLGNNARAMAEGALTVTMHDFINSMAGAMLPGSQLHGMGVYLNGYPGGERLPHATSAPNVAFDSELAGMGEYVYR